MNIHLCIIINLNKFVTDGRNEGRTSQRKAIDNHILEQDGPVTTSNI